MVTATLLISCVKENTPVIPLDNTGDTTIARQRKPGDFMNELFASVSGMATVYNQNESLVLAPENIMISNGPQLQVYLSKEVQTVNFINPGAQSIKGYPLYNIPGNPDFSRYLYALIRCKKSNHFVGSARLQ